MLGWFEKMFDMGNKAFANEMAELHEPGHAEKHSGVYKTELSNRRYPADYSFGTAIRHPAGAKICKWEDK